MTGVWRLTRKAILAIRSLGNWRLGFSVTNAMLLTQKHAATIGGGRTTKMLRGILRNGAFGQLERAAAAIARPGPVIQCLPIGGHLAGRGENLAGRTNVKRCAPCRM